MKNQFDDVNNIMANDPGTIGDQLQKLAEEFGEVATDINKITRRKSLKPGETMETIRENLTGEIAANIQILFAIAIKANIKYDDIVTQLDNENADYDAYVKKEFFGIEN